MCLIASICYAVNAAGDMKMMQDSLQGALRAQGQDKNEIAARLKNFHFAGDPMSGMLGCIVMR